MPGHGIHPRDGHLRPGVFFPPAYWLEHSLKVFFSENEVAAGSSCACFLVVRLVVDPVKIRAPDDEKGAEYQGLAAEDDVVAVL